jgi:ribonuclease D
MSRDRNDAVLRLLSSWFDRVAEDEDFPLRISVSKENFRAVVRYDLFRDHFRLARLTRMQLDASRHGARARERAMIEAWLAGKPRGRWRQ